jgi:predicted TIM-barrel fold metal-dependent hydrolase
VIDFPIIDSHIHLLDQERFGYSWAKDAPALKRDWTPDDLANVAKPYELEGVVFVEVDVDMPQHLDEADWIDSGLDPGFADVIEDERDLRTFAHHRQRVRGLGVKNADVE